MVFGSKSSDYDTMLQIVPSIAGFSPLSSREYSLNYSADNFDLSFLTTGINSERCYAATTNDNVQQYLSLYYDTNSPPPPYPHNNTMKEPITDYLTKGASTHQICENTISKEATFFNTYNNNHNTWNLEDTNDFLNKQFREKVDSNKKNTFLDMEMTDWADWEYGRNNWGHVSGGQPSSGVNSSTQSVTSSSSSSYCTSPASQFCPKTPPDFQSLLELEDIKQEITLNVDNLLAECKQCTSEEPKNSELMHSILEKNAADEEMKSVNDNHQMLRDVLKDVSIQKKYNLQPIDNGGLDTGFHQARIKNERGGSNSSILEDAACGVDLNDEIIAPILSRAIEQLMQDVDMSGGSREGGNEVTSPCTPSKPHISMKGPPGRGTGSHIHLWQFLKELLSSPQAHGSCIRWLDRNKGVFKIEDSVSVARLWGKRKNRPAMNYDKLSRSIRQYYKKGIMKKTERSQRLVYQFCTPCNF